MHMQHSIQSMKRNQCVSRSLLRKEQFYDPPKQFLSFSQESSSPVASKVEDDQIGFMEMSELLLKRKKEKADYYF